MRETAGSLRVYILISGALGALGQAALVLGDTTMPWLTTFDTSSRVLALVGLFVAGAYCYLGVTLNAHLEAHSRRGQNILLAGASYALLLGLLTFVMHDAAGVPLSESFAGTRRIGWCGLALLATLYWLHNYRRLAAERRPPAAATSSRGPG